jgi:hypothetical protein
VAQLCSSALLLQSAFKLERLSFYEHPLWSTRWQGDMESTQWMEFLRPFTAVKSLYLSKGIALRVARALEVLARGGAVTEILPVLQRFFVEGLEPSGSVQGAIEQFIAARQLSDHPVTVERWV